MDLVCYDDLDTFASETSDPFEEFKQDMYHRLVEEYGSNPDDTDRGVGLSNMLSGVADAQLTARSIESDLLKDERVTSCSASLSQVTLTNGSVSWVVEIDIGTDDRRVTLNFIADQNGVQRGVT